MPRFGIVAGPVEGHEGLAVALLVVHLVALLDLDAVHLDRAPVLRRHQDLRAHHLACKGKKEVAINHESVIGQN